MVIVSDLVWTRDPDWIYIPGQDKPVHLSEILPAIEGVVVPKQCGSNVEVGDQYYECLIDWSVPHGWHEESGHNHEGRPYSVRWRDEVECEPSGSNSNSS